MVLGPLKLDFQIEHKEVNKKPLICMFMVCIMVVFNFGSLSNIYYNVIQKIHSSFIPIHKKLCIFFLEFVISLGAYIIIFSM